MPLGKPSRHVDQPSKRERAVVVVFTDGGESLQLDHRAAASVVVASDLAADRQEHRRRVHVTVRNVYLICREIAVVDGSEVVVRVPVAVPDRYVAKRRREEEAWRNRTAAADRAPGMKSHVPKILQETVTLAPGTGVVREGESSAERRTGVLLGLCGILGEGAHLRSLERLVP